MPGIIGRQAGAVEQIAGVLLHGTPQHSSSGLLITPRQAV